MTVETMDSIEKKRIANEKRLKAVKLWKKNQTVKSVQAKNTRIVFDTEDSVSNNAGKNNFKLFDSEEEDETFEETFRSRPQFDGPDGERLLEMSSQFSGRFKLDERFRENEPKQLENQSSEKEKNIQILQSVLGYGISSKSAEKSSPRKRQIRFDPEDENASKYIKISEKPESSEPKKKKRKDKKTVSPAEEPQIPISTERYIEVSSNLKEILSEPSVSFSLSQKFSETTGLEVPEPQKYNGQHDDYSYEVIESEDKIAEKKEKVINPSSRDITRKLKKASFFIKEGDPRLKEGIEFFKRPKILDEIRREWNSKRETVLELFRRKKRSSIKSFSSKTKSLQPTNSYTRRKF